PQLAELGEAILVLDQALDVGRVEAAVRQIEHDELARERRGGELAHDRAGVRRATELQVRERREIGAVKQRAQILERGEIGAAAAEPQLEPLEPGERRL